MSGINGDFGGVCNPEIARAIVVGKSFSRGGRHSFRDSEDFCEGDAVVMLRDRKFAEPRMMRASQKEAPAEATRKKSRNMCGGVMTLGDMEGRRPKADRRRQTA